MGKTRASHTRKMKTEWTLSMFQCFNAYVMEMNNEILRGFSIASIRIRVRSLLYYTPQKIKHSTQEANKGFKRNTSDQLDARLPKKQS
jgi:hypothetical protein